MLRFRTTSTTLWLVLVALLLCNVYPPSSSLINGGRLKHRDESRKVSPRFGAPGKRTIDGLSGNCGKLPASNVWLDSTDAFCGPETAESSNISYVKSGDIPSYIHLEIRHGPKNETRYCSGVLIHPDSILTANSCVMEGAKSIRATAGMTILDLTDGTQQSFAWGYCRLFKNSKYVKEQDNNLVFVLLRKPFVLNERVQPVCVELKRKPNPNVDCYLAAMIFNSTTKRTLLYSFPFRLCREFHNQYWLPNSGYCYRRLLGDSEVKLRDQRYNTVGSGMYCLDKCGPKPVVSLVGLNTRNFEPHDDSGLQYEIISVTKTDQHRPDMEGMLENCYELPTQTI